MVQQQSNHKRVGLFGGAFDPPHLGHVAICRWLFTKQQVDETWVIPCFIHPFGKPLSPFEHRLAMCRFAFASFYKQVFVSAVEKDLGGISFTLRTITHLQQRFPSHRFHLIAGSDNEDRAAEWHKFDEIKKLVSVITVPRGNEGSIPDISSTDIRERVRRGERFAHLTPKEVAVYIVTHQLYRGDVP